MQKWLQMNETMFCAFIYATMNNAKIYQMMVMLLLF